MFQTCRSSGVVLAWEMAWNAVKRIGAGGGRTPGGWKGSLATVLRDHNGAKAAGGSVASYATQDARKETLFKGFEELRKAGYRMDVVQSFRETHMKALVQSWEKAGLSASTISNRISVFRTFAGWIGKSGMIERAEKYVSRREVVARSTICKESKSWQAAGVDPAAKIAEISAKNARVGLQVELQRAFGLRMKESALLRPGLADKGAVGRGRHCARPGAVRSGHRRTRGQISDSSIDPSGRGPQRLLRTVSRVQLM